MGGEKIIVVYEPEQVEIVLSYIKYIKEPYKIIAVNFWAERLLVEKNISYESFDKYAPTEEETDHLYTMVTTFAREWYRLPELSFFQHKGVSIGEAAEPGIDSYLERTIYYLHVFKKIIENNSNYKEFVVPHAKGGRVPPTVGSLVWFEIQAPVAVARFLAAQYKLSVITIGKISESEKNSNKNKIESISFKHVSLGLLNWLVTNFVSPRPIKIFASEYWGNIALVIEKMDDAELVLMDRGEIKNVSWRYIFSRRIRFIHYTDVLTSVMKEYSAKASSDFFAKWNSVTPAVDELVKKISPEINWWPLVEKVISSVFKDYTEEVLMEAESLERLLILNKSNRVVLRGSFSGRQTHFFVATCISRSLKIPSIEIQHAGEVLDSRSVHSRLSTSYLAAYGDLTKDGYVRSHGYAPERIRSVGSPRFDHYLESLKNVNEDRSKKLLLLGLDPSRPVLLAVVQGETLGTPLTPYNFSSYDAASFFSSFKKVKEKIPNIQIIFKFRPGYFTDRYKKYIGELFAGHEYLVTEEDLFSKILISDIVSSGNSTALYEAMIAKIPLILFPWKKIDRAHTNVYGKAAPVVYSDEDLISEIRRLLTDSLYTKERMETQNTFFAKNYCFDGYSAERAVTLLREDLRPV